MNHRTHVISHQNAMNDATLETLEIPGLYASVLRREGCEEYWISSVRREGDSPATVLERAGRHVTEAGAEIVSLDIMGLPTTADEFVPLLEHSLGPVRWPITWIGGSGNEAGGGVQIWAVRGPAVRPVQREGRIAGTVFEDAEAQFCRLGGLIPSDITLPPTEQAAAVFWGLEETLQAASMDFGHAIRTWYYNRDILAWYDDFNAARNRFFEEQYVFDSVIPASTGIGAVPPNGAAIVGGLVGVKAKSGNVNIAPAPSPLQCSAVEYGSSFSRAVIVTFTDHERLFVSGTASISHDGVTTYARNIDAQIERTMRVVESILNASDMDWSAVTRGIAYVKHACDLPRLSAYRSRTGLESLPLVIVNADICRDNLLFEIEVDAVRIR